MNGYAGPLRIGRWKVNGYAGPLKIGRWDVIAVYEEGRGIGDRVTVGARSPWRRNDGRGRGNGSGTKRRIMMGRTNAFPSQFSGKEMRKKKAEKKKAEGGIAEGKPENPRADAHRSERERRPGSSRQEQGNRKDRASKRSS